MNFKKVIFQPANFVFYAPPGMPVKNALILAGIFIDFPCGGEGKCGKCKVKIESGATKLSPIEKRLLTSQEIKRNIRLACQANIEQDTVVFIYEKTNVDIERKPATIGVQKKYRLSPVVRKSPPHYGLALDIGTTTVSGVLVNLCNGEELSVISETNPQIVYGADVISRINYAIFNDNGLLELKQKVISVVNSIISKLEKKTQVDRKYINDITVVGNTVMQHLFLGINPQTLASVPFKPVTNESINVMARELEIEVNPEANVYVFPNIGGFVGGDVVGSVLALDLHNSEKINLMIDIGTNSEIVLGSHETIICTSTAAGPAFEGAEMSSGMRATPGAIESVYIADEGIFWRTIGHTQPKGICGSGIIDIVAELLKIGIIDESGRMKNKNELYGKLTPILLNSIVQQNSQNAFMITPGNGDYPSQGSRNCVVTQEDIRKVQLAKGAIRAGVEILKKKLKINNEDINQVFIAGTFGNYIDKKNAQVIGLIPDIPLENVIFVGNAALEGAKLALISEYARKEIERLVQVIKYMDLSAENTFQEEFTKAMYFE